MTSKYVGIEEATVRIAFTRIRSGRYVQPESGLLLIRGLDDADGYARIEWQIWTPGMGTCVGLTPTLNAAKARAREILTEATAHRS